jgi:hypothetical protein
MEVVYSKTESLVLRARSEMVGSAIGNICSWFQVSGFSAAAGLRNSRIDR